MKFYFYAALVVTCVGTRIYSCDTDSKLPHEQPAKQELIACKKRISDMVDRSGDHESNAAPQNCSISDSYFLAEVHRVTATGHTTTCVCDAGRFNEQFLDACYDETQLEFFDQEHEPCKSTVIWYQLNEENLKLLARGKIPYRLKQASEFFKIDRVAYYRLTVRDHRKLSADYITTLQLQ